ncbi:tetratricopeptide repeat protein [Nocardioides sp. GY 10127]|uniref:tetratricopeptide repeat protein n=1 Tax=Nocardioides sp. GY 10127 TaxID=2569762 RepID=UPI0010A87161|nr:tetratricopeptide repeat protein [Nocardioides sp. GY 10127]TIC85626.1 sel1 repeat family protein [Nocardioides sp. GY 10127]
MKRLIAGLAAGAALCGLAVSAVPADASGTHAGSGSAAAEAAAAASLSKHAPKKVDILKVSGLTATDFENVALIYKTESQEGDDQYALELKFAKAAAALGSANAMLWMGEMYQGEHIGVTGRRAVQIAIRWWNLAAEAGMPRGWANIGLLYMHNTVPGGGDNFAGIPLDNTVAFSYMLKASDAGDSKAPRYLGLMYQDGTGVGQDDAKAAQYFELASDRGDSTGRLYYADYLLAGTGVDQDVEGAIALYKALVDDEAHDIATAAYTLGEIYEQGVYVPADTATALSYYEIALANGNTDAQAAIDRLS